MPLYSCFLHTNGPAIWARTLPNMIGTEEGGPTDRKKGGLLTADVPITVRIQYITVNYITTQIVI